MKWLLLVTVMLSGCAGLEAKKTASGGFKVTIDCEGNTSVVEFTLNQLDRDRNVTVSKLPVPAKN